MALSLAKLSTFYNLFPVYLETSQFWAHFKLSFAKVTVKIYVSLMKYIMIKMCQKTKYDCKKWAKCLSLLGFEPVLANKIQD